MKPATMLAALLFALPAAAGTGEQRAVADRDSPSGYRQQTWSGNHALTIEAKRLELGLFQSAHYGVGHNLELSLHPVSFFALPHVELKTTLASSRLGAWLGLRARLSYPTLFLGLVSRSGSGGLLPATSDPPPAVQGEIELITTRAWGHDHQHLASVLLGLALAAHGSFAPEQLPLLDFPFLYQRFAPLYAPLVPRFGASCEGPLIQRLWYDLSVTYYLMPSLPDVGLAYALEPAAALEYRFAGDRVALSLGLRGSGARYAYGTRFHYLPHADVRVGF
jgi:hypothetical protein